MSSHRVPRWSVAVLVAALVVGGLLAGCGGSGGDAGDKPADGEADATSTSAGSDRGAQLPKVCQGPPLTMRLEAGDPALGSAEFAVTDAVARRVPILPGEKADSPADLPDLQAQAEKTALATYSLYVGDFEIDRSELTGFGFGMVTPPTGKTVGVVSIVPQEKRGLKAGDTVTDAPITYKTTTTFAPVQVMVQTADDQTPRPYTDTIGQVEVLALDDDRICLDIDVTFENQGSMRYAAEGVVVAPVVRSDPSFFYT